MDGRINKHQKSERYFSPSESLRYLNCGYFLFLQFLDLERVSKQRTYSPGWKKLSEPLTVDLPKILHGGVLETSAPKVNFCKANPIFH